MNGSGRVLMLLAATLLAGCAPTPPVSPTAPVKPVDTTPIVAPPSPPVTEDLKWERLDIGMEPDSVFQPWMLTTSIKVLEGKPVRIKGWMNGAVFQRSNIRQFHLMREKECPFGPGGQAHHAIEVELQGKLRTDFTTDEITVEGIFRVAPVKGENGNTLSVYRIEGTAVK
ncbi:hypothetical protein [Anatilimnocola floriformis]|uniref:hypothetical protein n=1 Tax=Anatilimnocola floriformis TaxID=2948575 RepID=UPI0020C1EFF2|nr:hypothetical protein [Anatilimnocola floriformis]